MRLRSLLILAAATALAGHAQELDFEVASVKPSTLSSGARAALQVGGMAQTAGFRGGPGTSDPGQINYSVSLKMSIARAYNLRAYQVSGPEWLDTEFYTIVAKVPPGTTKDQCNLMLQRLLTERFRIESHRESRPMTVYTLTVAKDGPKLTPALPAPSAVASAEPADRDKRRTDLEKVLAAEMASLQERDSGGGSGPRFHIAFPAWTVADFALYLSNSLNEPVIDQTGIEGKYAFNFTWTSDSGPVVYTGAPIFATAGPSLFSAVQRQLGLKLEPGKAPVEILVVDKAERIPTEN